MRTSWCANLVHIVYPFCSVYGLLGDFIINLNFFITDLIRIDDLCVKAFLRCRLTWNWRNEITFTQWVWPRHLSVLGISKSILVKRVPVGRSSICNRHCFEYISQDLSFSQSYYTIFYTQPVNPQPSPILSLPTQFIRNIYLLHESEEWGFEIFFVLKICATFTTSVCESKMNDVARVQLTFQMRNLLPIYLHHQCQFARVSSEPQPQDSMWVSWIH